MRRLLNPVVRNLTARVRLLAEDWDTFWFQPADPTLLGLLRILTGLMLFTRTPSGAWCWDSSLALQAG